MGNFCIFLWFLSDISATRGRIHTKFYLCRDNVCRRAPSPSGVHLPLGAGGRGVKNSKKWGVVSFVQWSATVSVFLSVVKCGSICRVEHRPAHILALSHPGWPRGFHRVGQKIRKNRIFDHFENVRPYISATVINRGI